MKRVKTNRSHWQHRAAKLEAEVAEARDTLIALEDEKLDYHAAHKALEWPTLKLTINMEEGVINLTAPSGPIGATWQRDLRNPELARDIRDAVADGFAKQADIHSRGTKA